MFFSLAILASTGSIFLTGSDVIAAENNFNLDTSYPQTDFSHMIVGYTEDGIPIVDAPETLFASPRAVYATVISPYGYLYSSSGLNNNSLLFSIPRGKKYK